MNMISLFLRYFSRGLMLLLVMPLTNSARGLVAKWQGDDSAESAGRITLNPFVHLDPLGSLAILLCGFGWSKPMPLNPARMKNYRRGVVLLSLTGPVTHFLAAIVCNAVIELMLCSPAVYRSITSGQVSFAWCIAIILTLLSNINVCLGVINILPIPPMDGFNILNQFAGAKFHRWYYSNFRMINQASTVILLILFFMPSLTAGRLDPLGFLIDHVAYLLSMATNWIPAAFRK